MRQKNSKMLSSTLAVVLTLVVFLVVWKILLPSYSDNKAKAEQLTTEVNNAQSEISSIEAAKESLSSISTTVNELLVAIPKDKDEANLISELEAIGAKNSIAIPTIGISAMDTTGATDAFVTPTVSIAGTPITVTFAVTGPFENVSAFTDALEQSIKFMHIKSLTMSSQENNVVSASYTIEAFTRETSSTAEATQ